MLRISLEKCKKLLKNKKIVIPAVIVLVVVTAGVVIAVQHTGRTNAVADDKSQITTPETVKTLEPTAAKTTDEAKTEEVQPSPSVPAKPQAQTPSTKVAPKSTPQSSQNPASTAPPQPKPLYVHSLFTVGVDTICVYGQKEIGLNEISISLFGDTAGTLNWQIEEQRSGVVSIVRSGSVPLAAGQPFYDLRVNDYRMRMIGAGDTVRVHVTSPSEAATAWYTIDNSLCS